MPSGPHDPSPAPAVQAPRAPGELEALFTKAPAAMLVLDAGTMRIVRANEAATRALGRSADELAASRFDSLVAPADRERLARLLAESPATTGILTARSSWELERRDGATVRMEVHDATVAQAGRACLILYQPGRVAERPAADQPAADAMPPFSFSALHDLKEPLHIIKGYLGILRSRTAGRLDPGSQECLDEAHAATLRLQAVVLNLLEFFRAEAKGIHPEPVALAQLADEAVAALRLQVEEAQATVTRDELPTVLADRFQLSRVLQNLLGNALKFRAAAPARVHVFAQERDDAWEVCVSDNGIGIPESEREKVLEPFHRLHSGDEYPGTGLGLSISKKVVELHGGRIWIESRPGAGTSVHFTLPKEPARPKEPPRAERPERTPAAATTRQAPARLVGAAA